MHTVVTATTLLGLWCQCSLCCSPYRACTRYGLAMAVVRDGIAATERLGEVVRKCRWSFLPSHKNFEVSIATYHSNIRLS